MKCKSGAVDEIAHSPDGPAQRGREQINKQTNKQFQCYSVLLVYGWKVALVVVNMSALVGGLGSGYGLWVVLVEM